MADALVAIALEKLTNILQQQLTLFAGATHELESLKDTFQSIQAALRDAESRQVTEESVRVWLLKLKNVSYDINDVLDEGKLLALGEKGAEEVNSINKVRQCLLSPYHCVDHAVSRYKFACRIKEIRERLDRIADDKKKYNFISSSGHGGDASMPVSSQRLTSSLVGKSEKMIGRENDKETVISRLISESSSHENGDGQVHVVVIVGIGGLGKTTLAQQIYHDSRVQVHFNKALYWVCVSETFDVTRLTKEIIEQVKGTSTSLSGLDSLQSELFELLRGKRFLLVLDDIWNDDPEKWNKVAASLESGAHGSRILVTTRSYKVASAMKACVHELKGLSYEQSWELFSSRAFEGRKAEEYLEQGKEIVKRCRGVPLSIKVIGSAMRSKITVDDWKNVLDSQIWALPQVTEKILPALLLTYSNLPTYLKQCFAYCSMFPKDSEWKKSLLVRLWLAVDFIRPEGNRELEDIGAEYFDDLVARSMFLQVKENFGGEITYKMHDLLHDLAQFIAKDEIYTFTESSDVGKLKQCPSSSHFRHAFLDLCSQSNFPIAYNKLRKLQTVRDVRGSVAVDHLCHQARFLRALVIGGGIVKLPKAIGKLKHLRYLDLSHADIVNLPESVSRLCNLHTLNLTGCYRLKKLPRGMSKMVSLRHLEIEGTSSLEYLPKGLGKISRLRSLGKFTVGDRGRGGDGCGIDELRQLNSLRGTLRIEHLERVSSLKEAETAELWNKPHLGKLVLCMADEGTEVKVCNVLEGLRPQVNLEELELNCHSSSELNLPSWMEDLSFSKLTKLKIEGFEQYVEPKNLPGLGKLPALQSLQLSAVGVRKVDHEFYYGSSSSYDVISAATTSFPRLEEVSLRFMDEWEEWSLMTTLKNGDDALKVIMPCLRKLELFRCSQLEKLPYHLANSPLTYLSIKLCRGIKGTGCYSFTHLETFVLSGSSEFLSSSDMPDLPKLKTLQIKLCRNERLPDRGWERLVALQELEIGWMKELKSLPDDGLMHLQSLKRLFLSSCDNLVSLPDGMGQLKRLESLRLESLEALTCVPDSLGLLESLESLEIGWCGKLCTLPDSLGQLKKLKTLDLTSLGALTCVPDSLGLLESLESLEIFWCRKLCSLPDSLGQLKKLNKLLLNGLDALTCVPDSLGLPGVIGISGDFWV